jgi:hypothetical protein
MSQHDYGDIALASMQDELEKIAALSKEATREVTLFAEMAAALARNIPARKWERVSPTAKLENKAAELAGLVGVPPGAARIAARFGADPFPYAVNAAMVAATGGTVPGAYSGGREAAINLLKKGRMPKNWNARVEAALKKTKDMPSSGELLSATSVGAPEAVPKRARVLGRRNLRRR